MPFCSQGEISTISVIGRNLWYSECYEGDFLNCLPHGRHWVRVANNSYVKFHSLSCKNKDLWREDITKLCTYNFAYIISEFYVSIYFKIEIKFWHFKEGIQVLHLKKMWEYHNQPNTNLFQIVLNKENSEFNSYSHIAQAWYSLFPWWINICKPCSLILSSNIWTELSPTICLLLCLKERKQGNE